MRQKGHLGRKRSLMVCVSPGYNRSGGHHTDRQLWASLERSLIEVYARGRAGGQPQRLGDRPGLSGAVSPADGITNLRNPVQTQNQKSIAARIEFDMANQAVLPDRWRRRQRIIPVH